MCHLCIWLLQALSVVLAVVSLLALRESEVFFMKAARSSRLVFPLWCLCVLITFKRNVQYLDIVSTCWKYLQRSVYPLARVTTSIHVHW